MSEIFVNSAKGANWHSMTKNIENHAANPNLHWCHLVDKTEHDS